MKKAVLKKVAIAAAIALASTGTIALVAGMFVSDGPGSSKNCSHESKAPTLNVGPTCTLGGAEESLRCLDCGEIVVKGKNVPALGHTGEIGEYCSVCGDPIYGATQNPNIYTLVEVEEGETVVGHWYRLMRPESNDSADTFQWTLRNVTVTRYEYTDGTSLYLMANKWGFYGEGYIYGPGPMGYFLQGLPCVVTKDYIDVYFEVGTYDIVGLLNSSSSQGVVNITENATISLSTFGDNIKRIVFGD